MLALLDCLWYYLLGNVVLNCRMKIKNLQSTGDELPQRACSALHLLDPLATSGRSFFIHLLLCRSLVCHPSRRTLFLSLISSILWLVITSWGAFLFKGLSHVWHTGIVLSQLSNVLCIKNLLVSYIKSVKDVVSNLAGPLAFTTILLRFLKMGPWCESILI